MNKYSYLISLMLCWIQITSSSDITSFAFGSLTDVMPAAFGDFNSDELTDLFVIDNDSQTVKILIASAKEPFFQYTGLYCRLPSDYIVTSVIPGDFDGDALMDFLVTAIFIGNKDHEDPVTETYVFINWGNMSKVNCSKQYAIKMLDEPLVIDYDQNLIADLFGRNIDNMNVFWIFSNNRSEPIREKPLHMPLTKNFTMRSPHSHAFVDLNHDNGPDLYLTTNNGFGAWYYDNTEKDFFFHDLLPYPKDLTSHKIGQNLFMDLETAGSLQVIVPVCKGGEECTSSGIYVYADGKWVNLNVSFNDNSNKTWNFIAGDGRAYTDTITLRSGDFNNDGYVDLLATLQQKGTELRRTFLLENVPCSGCSLRRTFSIQWNGFGSANINAVMGTFYDFLQDGIMDVIFVHTHADRKYRLSAFKNDLDYDANFVKVMVISGLKNKESEANSAVASSLLSRSPTFGTSLPGPKIRYKTTNQDGQLQLGVAVQLPQSAHFALYLPYTIFGLGRTPNFVEDLFIGMFNQTRTWTQIIPNSQMVVIPYPQDSPWRWKAQLFVTPSKIVLQTVAALAGTCVVIALIIALLHWKERREDRIERLQEAHRFHFDAM